MKDYTRKPILRGLPEPEYIDSGLWFINIGLGTNSAAVYELHRLDVLHNGHEKAVMVFSDTGGERPDTYDYEYEFYKMCKRDGFEFVRTCYKEKGKQVTLEEHCLRYKMLPSIAYGGHRRSCSMKFKGAVIDKEIKNRPEVIDILMENHKEVQLSRELKKLGFEYRPKIKRINRVLGFDADEDHRVEDYDDYFFKWHFPLYESGITREFCKDLIVSQSSVLPPKSSCDFCPVASKNPSDIREYAKRYPERMKEIIHMERVGVSAGGYNKKHLITRYKGELVDKSNYIESQWNEMLSSGDMEIEEVDMWATSKIQGLAGHKGSWEQMLNQGDMFDDDFEEFPISSCIHCNL